MISRRVWKKGTSFSDRRWLLPCSRGLPATATMTASLEQKPIFLRFFSEFAFRGASSVSLRFSNDCVLFGIPLFNQRHFFSSHAAADPATGGIVDVPLAQTGEGIVECELLKWFVQEGDQVEEFQQLCEVQSDKATIEITSRYEGKVSQILHVPGDIIKVGETLLRMHVEESQASTQQIQTDEVMESTKSIGSELSTQKTVGVLSTPPVRNLAKQYNININDVLGTGKDGRILKEDVFKYSVQKGIIEDSSASPNVRPDQALGGEESYSQASPEIRWNYEDKKIPLR